MLVFLLLSLLLLLLCTLNHFHVLFAFLFTMMFARSEYARWRGRPPKMKGLLHETLWLAGILLTVKAVFHFFGGAGVWALVLVVLLIAGSMLFRQRKIFVEVLRGIEKKHFGETREERRDRLRRTEL
jgi:hypothetical protein